MGKLSSRDGVLPSATTQPDLGPKASRGWLRPILLAGLLGAGLLYHSHDSLLAGARSRPTWNVDHLAPVCPQTSAIAPSNTTLLHALYTHYANQHFISQSAELLGASVRIPTETYDGWGNVGGDERWDKFGAFHEWLEGAFPSVHGTLRKERVNTWGLVYTWEGSDGELKPLMLTAHQDVVPVEEQTYDQWIHPPFSGYFDGEWIWGRGSCDDKAGLVAIMIAIELLIKEGFTPTRTIILAFGFDEESSSLQGAGQIGKFLLDRCGEDGIAMIVDEGAGYTEMMGSMFAMPAVGEKGYIDVRMTVNTQGGHSSVPPPHTGIGILSSLITVIEANPSPPKLTRTNPFYSTLQCLAEYSPKLEEDTRNLIKRSRKSDKALQQLTDWLTQGQLGDDPVMSFGASLIVTTQAVDMIQGGVKVNALPEQAWAIVNHRISVDDSPAAVQARWTELITPEAAKWNLSLDAFGHVVNGESSAAKAGSVVLADAFGGTALEPAPITPTEGAVWDILGGTIKTVYQHTDGLPASARRQQNQTPPHQDAAREINMTPGVMGGNTDTHHYWSLTKHIFRYAHVRPEGVYNGYHTVNEAMGVENFMGYIEFFTTLIMNVDEAEL